MPIGLRSVQPPAEGHELRASWTSVPFRMAVGKPALFVAPRSTTPSLWMLMVLLARLYVPALNNTTELLGQFCRAVLICAAVALEFSVVNILLIFGIPPGTPA